eukprot:scaffold4841_cov132-Cylindrotheca_fusiformis.AAC.10
MQHWAQQGRDLLFRILGGRNSRVLEIGRHVFRNGRLREVTGNWRRETVAMEGSAGLGNGGWGIFEPSSPQRVCRTVVGRQLDKSKKTLKSADLFST